MQQYSDAVRIGIANALQKCFYLVTIHFSCFHTFYSSTFNIPTIYPSSFHNFLMLSLLYLFDPYSLQFLKFLLAHLARYYIGVCIYVYVCKGACVYVYAKQKHLKCKKVRGQSEATCKQAGATKSFDIS